MYMRSMYHELHSQAFGKAPNGKFTTAVGSLQAGTDNSIDAGDIHDGRFFPSFQVGEKGLRPVYHAIKVNSHDPFEIRVVQFLYRYGVQGYSGIVDDDVYLAHND